MNLRKTAIAGLMILAAGALVAASAAVYAKCGAKGCGTVAEDTCGCEGACQCEPRAACPLTEAATAAAAETADKPNTHAKRVPAVIGTHALAVLVRANVPLTIVDARGTSVKQHIPGAKLLSYKPEPEQIAAALPDKDALIVTYCGSVTCPASSHLAESLAKHGYRHILEYPEGIKGWTEAGHKVVTGKP